jgi:hypothetical protein
MVRFTQMWRNFQQNKSLHMFASPMGSLWAPAIFLHLGCLPAI